MRAFAGLTGDRPSPVRPESDGDADLLEHLATGVLDTGQPRGDRVVLIVDQFEELFTACQDPDSRAQFIRLLATGAGEGGAVSVVMVMRADYYGACAEHPELASVMGRSQVLVTAMTDADLRRIVLEPARRVGLTVEDGLAETIADDAAAQTGALPLVSTALLETWAARSGTTLTLAGYLTAGGVRGAVARLAETTWDGFDIAQRAACRRILLRLGRPGWGQLRCAPPSHANRAGQRADRGDGAHRADRSSVADRVRGHRRGRPRSVAAGVAAPA